MKILNLYAGIGGNRKLWGDDHDITAIEYNPDIAKVYQRFFPKDKVIVADAHKYLEEHFNDFDFIWSSPPCQSHSRIRNIAGVGSGKTKPIYPDMKLWQEIIFLNQIFQSSGTKFCGKYVVENVITYYKPLVVPQKCGRHYFWANFYIHNIKPENTIITAKLEVKQKEIGFSDFEENESITKEQMLNNCVEPELGLHIFQEAFREQNDLFT